MDKPNIPPRVLARVKAEIARCAKISKERYGITIKPKIIFTDPENQQRVAGRAYYDGHIIYYNPWFLTNETDEFLSRTVPHEFAHLVVREMQNSSKVGWKIDVHGPVFRKVMASFGVDKSKQSELHDYDVLVLPQYRMCRLYKCVNCNHSHVMKPHQHQNMIENPTRYGCTKCDNDLKLFK